jgi:ABC-2 type transport system permease protein
MTNSSVRCWRLEVKSELLKAFRTPGYILTTLSFPLMFYLIFGVAMAQQRPSMNFFSRYLLATYGVSTLLSAILFGFAVGLAVERKMGWLELKRAAPMPPALYMLAKGAVSAGYGVAVTLLLFICGAVFADVRMPATQWLALGATLVAGAAPFCALGLAIGYFVPANSAPGVVNVIFMPMAFCSGLWIPYPALPGIIQQIAPALPAYHLAQLGLAVLGYAEGSNLAIHVAALMGFTLVFGAIAWIGHERETA